LGIKKTQDLLILNLDDYDEVCVGLGVGVCCHIAVCCRVLPCVAVCWRVLKCTEAKWTGLKRSGLVVLRTLEKFVFCRECLYLGLLLCCRHIVARMRSIQNTNALNTEQECAQYRILHIVAVQCAECGGT